MTTIATIMTDITTFATGRFDVLLAPFVWARWAAGGQQVGSAGLRVCPSGGWVLC